jgi:hypothetical protein
MMGDYADMMLEGVTCEGCGVYMGDGDGYPERCKDCAPAWSAAIAEELKGLKVRCPKCGKNVKASGLLDHHRDVHANQEGAL